MPEFLYTVNVSRSLDSHWIVGNHLHPQAPGVQPLARQVPQASA
ncbi:hypothetical protein I545_2780 [Mycobacterium kansasii 662]|uniref:Uncharacterized protein n=1 Tax=Mycobacterium kansasii 662 TaxID=1299326 RepID=X7ZHN1_MYCKA|nr:hypothetical protein I545_2780 [Mycobacterium kansasii 662]